MQILNRYNHRLYNFSSSFYPIYIPQNILRCPLLFYHKCLYHPFMTLIWYVIVLLLYLHLLFLLLMSVQVLFDFFCAHDSPISLDTSWFVSWSVPGSNTSLQSFDVLSSPQSLLVLASSSPIFVIGMSLPGLNLVDDLLKFSLLPASDFAIPC